MGKLVMGHKSEEDYLLCNAHVLMLQYRYFRNRVKIRQIEVVLGGNCIIVRLKTDKRIHISWSSVVVKYLLSIIPARNSPMVVVDQKPNLNICNDNDQIETEGK